MERELNQGFAQRVFAPHILYLITYKIQSKRSSEKYDILNNLGNSTKRFTTTHQTSRKSVNMFRRVKYGLFEIQPERATDRYHECRSASLPMEILWSFSPLWKLSCLW
ncbi:hypothetical protein Rs2_18134 [Raphanus sativus]|nr:hypothetical protein Rs2_18134 [Raphanus sativus]